MRRASRACELQRRNDRYATSSSARLARLPETASRARCARSETSRELFAVQVPGPSGQGALRDHRRNDARVRVATGLSARRCHSLPCYEDYVLAGRTALGPPHRGVSDHHGRSSTPQHRENLRAMEQMASTCNALPRSPKLPQGGRGRKDQRHNHPVPRPRASGRVRYRPQLSRAARKRRY